ncbi:MAG: hypothetical protein CMM15_13200 [Rhodospirillaceae bacterium]|nr:hypothetical protein [Rhodospirillaceae bacterium]|tara:strand:- start:490 stop:1005 length:516 start_codon:yes stop_codon:yes gene_type:complete
MKKLCKQSITIFFYKKKIYVLVVETMNNKISLYRGLPGNREFSGIQGLPYFVFNPLRNLLFTKEDIDHSSPAKDMMTESGLGLADLPASSSASGGTGSFLSPILRNSDVSRITYTPSEPTAGAPNFQELLNEEMEEKAYEQFNDESTPIVCSRGGKPKDGVCPPGQVNIAG